MAKPQKEGGIVIKKATLGQALQVLRLIEQKETPLKQLQELLESGLLADLLYTDLSKVNREGFRKFIGLKALVPTTAAKLLIVDYSVKPSLINLQVQSHPDRKDVVNYDISKFERVLTLKPGENYVSGYENLKRLKALGKILLDVRVLKELLKHPNLIPEEWREGYTYFWDTIFRDSDGDLYVQYLYWLGGQWDWHCGWLGNDWGSDEPAACLACLPTGRTSN